MYAVAVAVAAAAVIIVIVLCYWEVRRRVRGTAGRFERYGSCC